MKVRISPRSERTLATIIIQAETTEEHALLERFKRDLAGQDSLALVGPAFKGELILGEVRSARQ